MNFNTPSINEVDNLENIQPTYIDGMYIYCPRIPIHILKIHIEYNDVIEF